MSTTGSPEVVSLTASSSTTYKASRREPELTSVLLDFFEVLAHRLGLLVVVKVFEFHVEHQALQALDLSEISGVGWLPSMFAGGTTIEVEAKGVRKSLRSPRRQSAGELLLMRRSIWFGLSLSCASVFHHYTDSAMEDQLQCNSGRTQGLLIMPMLLMMVLSLGLLLPDNSLIQFLCFPNSV
ncbi:hypothetical protein KCU75_g43, partial [Aureobasidium melanogenum]